MTHDQMIESTNEIIAFYRLIEQEYGINLTREVNHAVKVREDIIEAIWKAEHKEVWS